MITIRMYASMDQITTKQYKLSKKLIRDWVQKHFSDEKLAQVYAHNQDGRMIFNDPCNCLLGVTGVSDLHHKQLGCNAKHYEDMKYGEYLGYQVEQAYSNLGWFRSDPVFAYRINEKRQRRLSAILRGQLRLRDRARRAQEVSNNVTFAR